ncbi:class I SAM-dependent methyltransferase [Bradyrhizobium sp. HKCCYLS3013]|uniref:class I SAM-dependent methyltransferase n=1 Tax=Bradyrhizobium sp. HKCCYLS3013 TaxID=3420735 RepID=UPI003EC069BB
MTPWRALGIDHQPLDVDQTGIFVSASPALRYEEIPASRLTRLLSDIPAHGLREALRRHLGSDDLISEDYLFSRSRARFLERVPDSAAPDSRALEIGSGYGPIVRIMAQRYAEVVAIEASYERLRLSQLWHEEERLANIRYVRAGIGEIDLGKSQFDLVVMNGSLEWIPYEFPERPPRQTQLDALRRIHLALRPGGILYLGIENRFSLFALAAHPDPHTGIPFHSVVPRKVADLLARMLVRPPPTVPRVDRHRKYLNYTYSYGGYRRLLRNAGFGEIAAAVPWPSYNRPEQILTGARELVAAYRQHPLYRLAAWTGGIYPAALWSMAPGYGIYARREPDRASASRTAAALSGSVSTSASDKRKSTAQL